MLPMRFSRSAAGANSAVHNLGIALDAAFEDFVGTMLECVHLHLVALLIRDEQLHA